MRLLVLNILSFLLLLEPVYALSVPFEVVERAGVSRHSHVSYGIPFSVAENIKDINTLGVKGVDAQFRVTARYGGASTDITKPIRTVLVDFQDSFTAGEKKNYTLTTTGSGTVAGEPLASDSGSVIIVDTGTAIFHINKNTSSIFEKVWVGDNQLINVPANDGVILKFKSIETIGSPTQVFIEENGPLRCVIKTTGEFTGVKPPTTSDGSVPDSPIRYTIRYFFYKNKSYSRVYVTLRNENQGWSINPSDVMHNIRIDSLKVRTTVTNLSNNKVVKFDGYEDAFTTGNYEIMQDETSADTSTMHNWSYTISKEGVSQTAGKKYDSFVDLSDGSGGLMVANRWFWQNFPIGISVIDNRIDYNLLPDTGNTYRILGGMWKTYEILYYFHASDSSFDDELADLKKRPVIYCTEDRYAMTGFMDQLLPNTITLKQNQIWPGGESQQLAINRQRADWLGRFHSSYLTKGNTLVEHREQKTIIRDLSQGTYFNWYGWLRFGGTPRSNMFGFHNQHYDYSFLSIAGFMRFGDYTQLEFAEEFLRHKADILQIHDPDATTAPDKNFHGGQRYEQDALLDYQENYAFNSTNAPGGTSHYWTRGMTTHYMLTGEKHYLDVLQEVRTHLDDLLERLPTYLNQVETRVQARLIEAYCNQYILTGDTSFLTKAYSVFTDYLLVREGGCANPFDYTTCYNDGRSGWLQSHLHVNELWINYDVYNIDALITLYKHLDLAGLTSQRDTLFNFCARWGRWASTKLFGKIEQPNGEYRNSNSEYYPVSTVLEVNGVTGEYGTNTLTDYRAYTLAYSDLFAFLHKHTKDTIWLGWARLLFKDYHFYGTVIGWQNARTNVANVEGWPDNTLSGDWKHIRYILLSSYYLMTEWTPTISTISYQ